MGALGRIFRPRVGVPGEPFDEEFTRATHWGAVGWKALGAVPPWAQTGAYGDVVLTRRFSFNPGVQLLSRGFNPHTWIPLPGDAQPYRQTVRPGNAPGFQRVGSQYAPTRLTPWTAAAMRAALVRAQVAQSGLASVAFTKALISANMASY